MMAHPQREDFAREDPQQMLGLAEMGRAPHTRDELGIGTIRDAFANYLFPGTRSAQTRARYMLFVPWIYLELELQRVTSAEIAERARQDQISLIGALLESGDTRGLIGREAKEGLQRLPSSIYWSGLGDWGIRLFRGSREMYHRSADAFAWRQEQLRLGRDEATATGARGPNWDPGLPECPERLLQVAGFALTKVEAQYLQDRILTTHPHSLLAFLVIADGPMDAAYVWEHPAASSLPGALGEDVAHARSFSETIHGTALLYNLMLARAAEDEGLMEEYRQRLGSWADKLSARWDELLAWQRHLEAFWRSSAFKGIRMPRHRRAFVEEWLRMIFADGDGADMADRKEAQELICRREVELKGSRARLATPRVFEPRTGASRVRPLDFRWRVARGMLDDIIRGLSAVQ